MTSKPNTPLEFLAEVALARADASEKESVVLHLADTVVAALASQQLVESQKIRSSLEKTQVPSLDLLSLSASIRMTEVDDIDRSSGVTVSSIVVAAALSCFEGQSFTFSNLSDALSAGYHCTLRLARAMGGATLMGQGLWPSYLVATWGSAVTIGRMKGLNPIQMKNAMALALAQTPRGVGKSQGHWPGRWFLFGQAVERGQRCVQAAQMGIEADHGLLSLEWLQGIGGDSARMEALQERTRISDISFKPYCAAKQTLSCIGALQTLLQQGLDTTAIERVEVRVPVAYASMIDREPYHVSRLASMVSVKWQLALAALHPSGLSNVTRQFTLETSALERLMSKVEVLPQLVSKPDSNLDSATDWVSDYPAQWPGAVKVVVGGKEFEAIAHCSDGDPEHGLWGPAQIVDKARRLGLDASQIELVQGFLDSMHDEHRIGQSVEQLKIHLASNHRVHL